MAKTIFDMQDETEREIEIGLFQFERMFRTCSFFLDIDVEVLKESQFIDTIANMYFACFACLYEQEQDLGKANEFFWKDEIWVLDPPTLKNGDKMKFGEMIDAKQMIQDMIKLGNNNWECLLPLCAIFLHRKDEPYQESFTYENSDRIEMMKQLPMNIALEVSFFLKSSQTIFIERFLSFNQAELSQEVESM